MRLSLDSTIPLLKEKGKRKSQIITQAKNKKRLVKRIKKKQIRRLFDRCNFADCTFSLSLRLSPLRRPYLHLLFPSRLFYVAARPYHPSGRHFIPLSPRREVGGRGVDGCTEASAVGCGGTVGVECGVLHGGGVGGRDRKGE